MAVRSRQLILAITGTKGKTSLVRLLDHALSPDYISRVRVDSSGAFLNGNQVYSEADSREIWGYAPTNAPGRFLSLHGSAPGISILECTLFNAHTGLAYKNHHIGVFTNVFEDHIGAFPSIKTPSDIARMKSFVFTHIKPGGSAIYNADDKLVCQQLVKVPAGVTKIAVGLNLLPNWDQQADFGCTLDDKAITLLNRQKTELLRVKLEDLKWLSDKHEPSIYLALFAIATLFAQTKNKAKLSRYIRQLKEYQFPTDGGRMVTKQLANGVRVILDNAHETASLQQMAKYANSLKGPNGKLIGVLRLAPSRKPELVERTAQNIYRFYDSYYVYDKVDGHYRQAGIVKGYKQQPEAVGKMAHLFGEALKSCGDKPVKIIVREDQAVEAAVRSAGKGDIIVYIVGDDPQRSQAFIETTQTGVRK